MRFRCKSTLIFLPPIIMGLALSSVASVSAAAAAGAVLMDASGKLRLPSEDLLQSTSVTLVSSPGMGSSGVDENILFLEDGALVCRGATLAGTSEAERTALSTCSLVSEAMILEGITAGDVEAGLADSRHARTLTAIFRARLLVPRVATQTLLLAIEGDSVDKTLVQDAVISIFKAVASEKKGAPDFKDLYNLQVESVKSAGDTQKLLASMKSSTKSSNEPLSAGLSSAYTQVKEAGLSTVGIDTPLMAQAFVDIGASFNRQVRTVRAKTAAWNNRAARGLLVDGFGRYAQELRYRVLSAFDTDTRGAVGMPTVSAYRTEMFNRLETLVDSSIKELHSELVANLEKMILARLNSHMLKTMNDPVEAMMESNNLALKKSIFSCETILEDLAVPVLALTKEKSATGIVSKLNDALTAFPDSPAAKIKRKKKISKTVKKQKKPGQLGIDFGLDLVAMLRPDGFGSLQGFCGYQLGGNSITFGVHNDADDPQVIAQFGGVRPPLLRVQPKLRVDVEM